MKMYAGLDLRGDEWFLLQECQGSSAHLRKAFRAEGNTFIEYLFKKAGRG